MRTLEAQREIVATASRSYAHMFRQRVEATPEKVAFIYPAQTEPEEWLEMTWSQARQQVDALAAGLLSLGLEPEQRVAIIADTRLQWVLADLAVACAAGVTTTVYPSTHVEDEKYILTDSQCVMAIVENAGQLAKLSHDADVWAQLRHIILMQDDRDPAQAPDPRVLTWEELKRKGAAWLGNQPDGVDAVIDLLWPDSLSTLIYTSGTTGQPKGVELLHGAWAYEGAAVEQIEIIGPDDLMFLWLPLSHVFGRDLLSVMLRVGFQAVVDGRVNRLVQSIGETAPTVLIGVPRIFEKVRAAVLTMYPRQGLKGRISRWAFGLGHSVRDRQLAGRRLSPQLALGHSLADRLVFAKLHEKLGGRMRLMISGSAKLSPQVQEWFSAAGLTLVEGYGLTETAAIACVNLPQTFRPGTVGPPLPGIEMKLDTDGEVLFRGPIVARGYHRLPEATAESFSEGWFHTGDIGEIDADGFLRITDRKKDLMKTSNGKYVAPQKIESAIMANVPYAGQSVVVAEGRKFVSALLVLDTDQVASWAAQHGVADKGYAEVTQMPELRRRIDHYIRRANTKLEQWERIAKYIILDHEFTLDAGELTPSLKVRRGIVMSRYASLIEAVYADDSPHEFLPPSPERRRRRDLGEDAADGAAAALEAA